MKQFKVYLAGAITGLKYGEAVDWREYATAQLAKNEPSTKALVLDSGIQAYSPMRNNGFAEPMEGMPNTPEPLSSVQAILNRDHWDCKTADLILVNLLEAERVSIGTVMEIAWGYAYRIPTVLIMEKEGNLHDHGMIIQSAGWRVETLDEGIQTVKSILLP